MFKLVIIIFLSIFFLSCSKNEPIELNKLERKDGIYYQPKSGRFFTGKAIEKYDNKKKKREVFIKNGKLEGVATTWDIDGNKIIEESYVDGKREGLYKSWYKTGERKKEGLYRYGKKFGDFKYWNIKGENQVSIFLKEALEKYKEQDWKNSLKLLNKVLEYIPKHKEVIRYKKNIISEISNNNHLVNAKKNILDEDYKSALLKLRLIKESSVYNEEAKILIKFTEKKHLKYLFKLANELTEKNNYEEATTIMNLIEKINPNDKGLLRLKKEIDLKLIEKTPKKEKKKYEIPEDFKDIFLFYSTGKFNKAIEILERKKPTKTFLQYISDIEIFKEYKRIGDRAYKNKKIELAIKAYRKALYADARLSHFYSEAITLKLSLLYLLQSQQYFIQKKYAKSYRAISIAEIYNLEIKKYDKMIETLNLKAQYIYKNTFKKVNYDLRIKDFEIILAMLPDSYDIYKEVKTSLSNFGYLSILTIPKLKIKIDNKNIGLTPLKNFRLAVGKHKIKFYNSKKIFDIGVVEIIKGENISFKKNYNDKSSRDYNTDLFKKINDEEE